MAGKTINVLQGDSAAGSFRQAFNPDPGTLVVLHDLMSYGPLPAFDSLDQMRVEREKLWVRLFGRYARFSKYPDDLTVNFDLLHDAEQVIVWIGTGLSDHLMLLFVVWVFDQLGIEPSKLSVVQVCSLPITKRRRIALAIEVVQTGVLSPEDYLHLAEPKGLTADELAYMRRAWNAVTAPEPSGLVDVLDEIPQVCPLVRRALRTLIDRYPDADTGLSYTDWQLLCFSQSHSMCPRVIGEYIKQNCESLDQIGDSCLYDRLKRLANPNLAYPAVKIEGEQREMRNCTVTVTSAGQEILAGIRSFVEMNGIDDWVCGVHLDSRKGNVWYRRETLSYLTGEGAARKWARF